MKITVISLFMAAALALVCARAAAATFVYPAHCVGSYSSNGSHGKTAVHCDGVVLSLLDNGRTLIQFANKAAPMTPLGFSGGPFDFDAFPETAVVHVDHMDLQHTSNPSNAESLSGVAGECIVSGKINIRYLSHVGCVAKIEFGTETIFFHVDASITGAGHALGI